MKLAATLCISTVCVVYAVVGARSQSPDAHPTSFEVATIKENKSGDPKWVYRIQPGGRFSATRVSLVNLISIAYSNPFPLPGFLIVNGPDWIRTARFDVVAKADGSPAQELFPAMVRTLIEERFQLQAHRETRERSVLALVMARSDRRLGPSLRRTTLDCSVSAPPDECSDRNYPGRLTSPSVTMPVLARLLMVWDQDRRETHDETGLTGSYEATLVWTPDRLAPLPIDAPAEFVRAVANIDSNGPSLNTALQEQLGLKLETRKEPIEVVVVDRAQRPSID